MRDDWRLENHQFEDVELQYRQIYMGGESEWVTVGKLNYVYAQAILELLLESPAGKSD